MTPRAGLEAVVSMAALDVRRRPDHRAELGSQLLMGERLRLLEPSPDRRWWRVEGLTDGYRGWVRAWGLVVVPPSRARRWTRLARARVGWLFVEARESRGRGPLLSPLFWNTRVIASARHGRFRRIELPDGRRGWVPAASLTPENRRTGLIERVRGLLGVPYLWGGRTPLGFDCSGFTQQVLAEQRVAVARDAVEQFRRAMSLPRSAKSVPGDLIFFGARGAPVGHVGIGLGGGYYAHCRQVVRINSEDPSNPLYDNELGVQLRGWRRPVRRAP